MQTSYLLQGTIIAASEDHFLLQTQEYGTVQVNLGGFTPTYAILLGPGLVVGVCYDGRMTRSIPPQITLLDLCVPTLFGTITGIQGDTLTLVQDDGQEVIVHSAVQVYHGEGLILSIGQRIRVITNGVASLSLPPQVTALQIFPD